MNCVIYSRVSTEEQDNERAINELKEYAAYKKYNVIGIFEEKITGTTKALDRVEFAKMLDFIDKNEIHVILVWELSRVGRRMSDVINTVEYFNERKINIYAKKENLNTLNEKGERDIMTTLLIGILSSFAEVERDTFKKRSRSGIRANVLKGGSGTGNNKAFGYRKAGKMLVVDEVEANVVRQIFDKFLSGLGTTQIANYLNNQHVPTRYNKLFNTREVNLPKNPKKGSDFKWVDGTIYSILKNSIYCGKRTHRGEIFDIEPIISTEVFDKVQRTLKEKYNKKDIHRKYNNLFKTKIVCGKCGNTYFMHKRADNSDNVYKCLSKRYKPSCGNASVNIDKFNNAIFPYIINHIERSIKADNSPILADLDKTISNREIERDNLVNLLDSINKQEKKLLDLLLSETITQQNYTDKYNELIADRNRYNTQLDSIIIDLETLHQTKQKVIDTGNFDTAQIDLRHPDIELYKQFVADYIEHIKVYEISDIGCLRKEFTNRQDTCILLEIKALLSGRPYFTIISQRTKKQALVNGDNVEEILNGLPAGNLDYMMVNIGNLIKI